METAKAINSWMLMACPCRINQLSLLASNLIYSELCKTLLTQKMMEINLYQAWNQIILVLCLRIFSQAITLWGMWGRVTLRQDCCIHWITLGVFKRGSHLIWENSRQETVLMHTTLTLSSSQRKQARASWIKPHLQLKLMIKYRKNLPSPRIPTTATRTWLCSMRLRSRIWKIWHVCDNTNATVFSAIKFYRLVPRTPSSTQHMVNQSSSKLSMRRWTETT